MTRYTIQLYTNDGDQIYGRHIECNRKDIQGRLASIAMDYLKGVPYSGTIQALVNAGWNYTTYLIQLKNNTVTVYRHVFQRNVEGVGE